MKNVDVSVIIATYNAAKYLEPCLDSIRSRTNGLEYEVIVVDNGSADDSLQKLEQYPWVRVVAAGENLGYGRGNNRGLREATGKYVLFLNSDTLFRNNALLEFFRFAESHSSSLQIGALGAFLLDAAGKPGYAGGRFPIALFDPYHSIFMRLLAINPVGRRFEEAGDLFRVDFVCGADMFVPRTVLEEVGAFDPDFFLYYDETEFQHRMVSRGFRNYLIKGPQIVHLEGKSINLDDPDKANVKRIVCWESNYKYYQKTLGWLGKRLYRWLYAAKIAATFCFSIIRGKYNLSRNWYFLARSLRITGRSYYSILEQPRRMVDAEPESRQS